MIAFAKALEVIPRQICDNAGLDSTDILNKLRMKHANGEKWFGVDVDGAEGIRNNLDAFVWEPSLVKVNAISSATEAACLILSVDETVRAPQSEAVRVLAFHGADGSLTLLIKSKMLAHEHLQERLKERYADGAVGCQGGEEIESSNCEMCRHIDIIRVPYTLLLKWLFLTALVSPVTVTSTGSGDPCVTDCDCPVVHTSSAGPDVAIPEPNAPSAPSLTMANILPLCRQLITLQAPHAPSGILDSGSIRAIRRCAGMTRSLTALSSRPRSDVDRAHQAVVCLQGTE